MDWMVRIFRRERMGTEQQLSYCLRPFFGWLEWSVLLDFEKIRLLQPLRPILHVLPVFHVARPLRQVELVTILRNQNGAEASVSIWHLPDDMG